MNALAAEVVALLTRFHLQVTGCSPDAFRDGGDIVTGTLCPFVSTMGGSLVLFVGFFIIAGSGLYTRSIEVPAVLTVILLALVPAYIPGIARRLSSLYVIIAGTFLLYMAYRVLK